MGNPSVKTPEMCTVLSTWTKEDYQGKEDSEQHVTLDRRI